MKPISSAHKSGILRYLMITNSIDLLVGIPKEALEHLRGICILDH